MASLEKRLQEEENKNKLVSTKGFNFFIVIKQNVIA